MSNKGGLSMGATPEELFQAAVEAFDRDDNARGLTLAGTAAAEGYLPAQRGMGIAYLRGEFGLSIDADKALYWLNQAAEQGDGASYQCLAELYSNLLNDPDRAYSYLEQAAAHGFIGAYRHIGDYNYYEHIKHPDMQTAIDAYRYLAQRGDDYCAAMYGFLLLFNVGNDQTARNFCRDGAAGREKNEQYLAAARHYLGKAAVREAQVVARFAARPTYDRNARHFKSYQQLLEKLRAEDDGTYLYRGQVAEYPYPLRASAYRKCDYSRSAFRGDRELQLRKSGAQFFFEDQQRATLTMEQKLKRFLSVFTNTALGYPLSQAMLQQAGYSSEGLDVSYDYRLALFFSLFELCGASEGDRVAGHYYLKKNTRTDSVIYRWKRPPVTASFDLLQKNYYTCPWLIPSYELLDLFGTCSTLEESVQSIRDYLAAIGWGGDFWYRTGEITGHRPLQLIKLPEVFRKDCRIKAQKAALLLPDLIMSNPMIDALNNDTFTAPMPKVGLPYKLVQDLADASLCEIFTFECGGIDADRATAEIGADPDSIYDDGKPDLSHLLLYGLLETAYSDLEKCGNRVLTNAPFPSYGLTYHEIRDELLKRNKNNPSLIYRFDA